MADYESKQAEPKERGLEGLNTLIQLHFEKTIEKKHAIDLQKKELQKLFQFFFIFLSLVLISLSNSHRLQCRHCWIPITLLSLSHVIFYVSLSQTLRCINTFKYQKRCHKLTLSLATQKLRQIRLNDGIADDQELEVQYQEPPPTYFSKFKRIWALHFGFLIIIYAFMLSSSVLLLCF